MEKGGPSPISPSHCRVRRRSSRCGSPLLTCGSDVGVSHSLRPRVLHRYSSITGRRPLSDSSRLGQRGLKDAHHRGTRTRTRALPGGAPLSAGNPARFCPSRGLDASP
ncbi:hypothetical protein NDU88_001107 [Pleurodeles waltl]|uniref:Uncharacterized protein n=1 Tax=Pleurodeles waltl TaxID=8319 RepID=A0AAV7MIT4_PLEWA|nr:hypothetical protein NDU88_001107 [Pleurodeles waltl]